MIHTANNIKISLHLFECDVGIHPEYPANPSTDVHKTHSFVSWQLILIKLVKLEVEVFYQRKFFFILPKVADDLQKEPNYIVRDGAPQKFSGTKN